MLQQCLKDNFLLSRSPVRSLPGGGLAFARAGIAISISIKATKQDFRFIGVFIYFTVFLLCQLEIYHRVTIISCLFDRLSQTNQAVLLGAVLPSPVKLILGIDMILLMGCSSSHVALLWQGSK